MFVSIQHFHCICQ